MYVKMKEGQGRFNLEKDSKIRSGLDIVRELKLPPEIEGEKVLVHGQAAYDAGSISRSSWRMGFLYLTATRLIFTQGENRLFDIPLDSLNGLQIVSRNWVPGKLVQQLRLIKELDGEKSIFYLSVKEPQEWMKTIETAKKENLK
ncbi:MAG: hypothetical protein QMD08_05875 [Actinomycetota bacterium]|nr:hypothetical protein [Actinomycetota bacterium]